MEYQKIIYLLDNADDQPSKCGTKNWVEMNDIEHRKFGVGTEIRLETIMLKASLCDYSDTYILLK